MRRPRSLQGRLLAGVLGLVVAVWLVTAVMTWVDVKHELGELLDGHLAQAAALLVVQQGAGLEDDSHGLDAPSLHRYAPRVAFQVFHEGQLALRSSNAPTRPMRAPDDTAATGFSTIAMDGALWRVFATQGRDRETRVIVGERIDARNAILWAVLRSVLTPMAFALPLLAVAVWWAVRQGVAPMRALGVLLARRQPQALQPIAVDGAPSEMTPMLDALNRLFQRIDGLMASERRFTADAAHELRTPIAAIRAQAQVALASTDNAERAHALQSTLQGCDRATRLVEQLLTLSRLESGAAPPLSALDLGQAVRSVVAEAVPLALARRQTLALEAPHPCPVDADATLLSVLVRNLVDNAIRYSPPDASVQVTVRAGAAGAILAVEDSGPGLGAAEIDRLGERFFRVMGTGQRGSGLGWSIVRRIADVFGVRIRVSRSVELDGLAVELTFPPPTAPSTPASD